jgi:GNAT superfamily N-acetyltransferase
MAEPTIAHATRSENRRKDSPPVASQPAPDGITDDTDEPEWELEDTLAGKFSTAMRGWEDVAQKHGDELDAFDLFLETRWKEHRELGRAGTVWVGLMVYDDAHGEGLPSVFMRPVRDAAELNNLGIDYLEAEGFELGGTDWRQGDLFDLNRREQPEGSHG